MMGHWQSGQGTLNIFCIEEIFGHVSKRWLPKIYEICQHFVGQFIGITVSILVEHLVLRQRMLARQELLTLKLGQNMEKGSFGHVWTRDGMMVVTGVRQKTWQQCVATWS